MIGLIQSMLIKIRSCIVGIIIYGLILGLHKFIFSWAQARKDLNFWLLRPFCSLFPAWCYLWIYLLKLRKFKWEKEQKCWLLRNVLPVFFKNRKKCLDFGTNYPVCVHLSVIWNFNCSFKSIFEKKQDNFSLQRPSCICYIWSAYRNAPIPRNLFCPEKVLVVCL